jgi:hypothetical protein
MNCVSAFVTYQQSGEIFVHLIKLVTLLVLCSLLLSGCSFLPLADLGSKKVKVKEYNILVDGTLNSYPKVKKFAESEKTKMFDFILKDTKWETFEKADSFVALKPLTKEEKEALGVYAVVYDKYFTSLGADGIREVIILNGTYIRLYITLLWGKDTVYSVNRKVVNL